MRLELAKLRSATEMLFAHLEELGYDSIEISQDYYWDVGGPERYDPYKKPDELGLGQLSCDWTRLDRLLRNDREPVAYALVWLSALLRIVGEEIPG
jgi:hypothetical protein